MDIHLAGSRPTRRAPKEYFTGTVWQDPIIATEAPARLASNRVSFEPGARTNWHTHPLGQTLYVISGVGRVQTKGGPIIEIRPGDVVWIPPGEKHWHGASPANGMTHVAMQEALEGSFVNLDGAGDRRGIFRKGWLAIPGCCAFVGLAKALFAPCPPVRAIRLRKGWWARFALPTL